jgi:hypothetical protein
VHYAGATVSLQTAQLVRARLNVLIAI